MNNTHNQNQDGRVSPVVPSDLFSELEATIEAKSAKKDVFMICASNGDYVEAKESKLVDVGITGIFYVHRPIVGDGFVVSEGTTGLKIETGPNVDITLGRARSKIKSFIEKNGEEAFKKLLANSKKQVPAPVVVTPAETTVTPNKPIKTIASTPKAMDIHSAIESSLNHLNVIDLEYIADMLNLQEYEVEDLIRIGCLGFFDPVKEVWETPETYLSGNVGQKLKAAKEAAEMDARFDVNVEKLEDVIPEVIPSALIQYSLGAAWIPLHVFEAFALELFKVKITIQYLAATGKYLCKSYSGVMTPQISTTYAAGTKSGLEIFNATMNNQQMVVTHDGVKDIEDTAAAQGMQEQIQEEFQAYIMSKPDFQQETEEIYNDRFNSFRESEYRISTVKHYEGASSAYELFIHQKRGVLRAMIESALFAHCVGSGKSILIMTTAIELKRLGKADKPLIVVQNKTRIQFVNTFRELYPDKKIFAPTEHELTGAFSPDMYHRILEEDWDAIVLPQSQFVLIPDDLDRQRELIKRQILGEEEVLARTNQHNQKLQFKELKRILKGLHKELDDIEIQEHERIASAAKYAATHGQKTMLNFEDLKIDALLIDEFHFAKRLGFYSQLVNIKGIDTAKSKRSQSVLLKMRWVQQMNEGRNTLTYTGTPVSNTMAEAWTMIRYVRPDILKDLGIEHFDQFAKTFGQIIPSLEQTGGGTFKIQNRFAKFQNLPEFITAFRACTDVVTPDDIKEFQNTDTIPKLKGGQITQVVVKQSLELKSQIKEFRDTLEWWENLEGAEKRANRHIPLVIFNKAKQASIDLRLLDPTNKDCPDSKVNQVIRNALQVYRETGKVQMIFSDLYRSPEPKDKFLDEDGMVPNPAFGFPRFNLFNDIKKKLIAQGVKSGEIAILTESKWDKADNLEKLFIEANAGKIKFLLGSTERLGVGINAQQRLIAVHHVDAPPRPMDFEQRNGRILRQGNLNKEVWVFAYGVEKTLDSAAYQRLATKQRFINQIMKGTNVDRVMEDAADESQMTFDEMMAHLSDSPYAMQKLLVDNRIKSERMKRDNFNAKRWQMERQIEAVKYDIGSLRQDYDLKIGSAQTIDALFPPDQERKVVISGEEILESKTMAIDGYVEHLIELYRDSPVLSATGHFLLNGVKVNVHVDNTERRSKKKDKIINVPVLRYNCPEIQVYPSTNYNGNSVGSNSGFSLMSAIDYQIISISEQPKRIQAKIEKLQETFTELERNLGSTFDDSKLNALEAELQGLEQKMLEEKNEVLTVD